MNISGVYFLEFDKKDDDVDLLIEIRNNYFKNHKRLKNKVTKLCGSHVFKFSYDMQENHPLKWKKMKDDKIVQKSVADNNGSYKINTYANGKVLKTCYFSGNHEIEKAEYFSCCNGQKAVLIFNNEENTVKLIKFNDKLKVVCELYPCDEHISDKEIEILNMYIGEPLLIVTPDKGTSYYYSKDELNKIKGLLEDSRNKDNKIMLVCKENSNKSELALERKTEDIIDNKIEDNQDDVMLDKNSQLEDKKLKTSEISEKSVNKTDDVQEDKNSKTLLNSDNVNKADKNYCSKEIPTVDNNMYYYYGELKNNKRNGKGRTAVSDMQTAYEGDYVNDKREGFGVYYYKSGKVSYVGSWKNNKKNGLGVSFIKDSSNIHIGNWQNDKISKTSCIINENGDLTFCPDAKDNEYNKTVVNYNSLGKRLVISSVKDKQKTGKVTEFDEFGNLLYNGNYKDSKRNGFGISYNINGEILYKGNFKNDLYDGKGTIFFENGHKIEGEFEFGKLTGVATEYDNTGYKIYEGEFKENFSYNGYGKYFFKDGRCCKGNFLNGAPNKIMNLYDNAGRLIYKGCLDKNYKYSGVGECYIDGIKIYEGAFKDNKRCGFGTSYKNNNIEYIGWFNNDLFNGQGIYYENGKIKYVGSFLNGLKHKRVNEIKDNKIYRECIYEKDKLVYMNEYSQKGGNLILSGNISNGKLSGMGCVFTEYGEKKYEGIFIDGNLLRHMEVSLKKLESLPECDYLFETDYEKFRYADEFAVEKNIMGGIYSGELLNDVPCGKGTILYPDHRYTGCFENGKPKGVGIIYKNDGSVIKCKVVPNATEDTKEIAFMNGVKYNITEE